MKPVLVVEDEETCREWLESKLISHGFDVKTTETAESTLPLLEQEKFSILMTDMQLPQMHGLELIKIAKKKQPQLPIIAMSSIIERYSVELDYIGVDAYFEKPVDIERLFAQIEQIFSRSCE